MKEEARLRSKRRSKTNAVVSQIQARGLSIGEDDVYVGPSDYVPWQKDNKLCFLRIESRHFGDVPMNLECRLSVEDSPNSAGVVIDAIRCAKVARDRGIGGSLDAPSAYFMKTPPKQFPDTVARDMVERFAQPGAPTKATAKPRAPPKPGPTKPQPPRRRPPPRAGRTAGSEPSPDYTLRRRCRRGPGAGRPLRISSPTTTGSPPRASRRSGGPCVTSRGDGRRPGQRAQRRRPRHHARRPAAGQRLHRPGRPRRARGLGHAGGLREDRGARDHGRRPRPRPSGINQGRTSARTCSTRARCRPPPRPPCSACGRGDLAPTPLRRLFGSGGLRAADRPRDRATRPAARRSRSM